MLSHSVSAAVDLFRRRASSAPPPADPPKPDSLTIEVGAEDGPEELREAPGNPLFDLIGQAIGIEYVDSKGQRSRRRITIRSCVPHTRKVGADLALHALCHERRAPRMFYISQVASFIDLRTGEVFSDATGLAAVLAPSSKPSSPLEVAGQAIRLHRRGLNILVYLARCDGLHASEHSTLVNYVLDSELVPADCQPELVEQQILRLYPDVSNFDRAVNSLQVHGGDDLPRIARFTRRLLDADGALSDAEVRFAAELDQILQR